MKPHLGPRASHCHTMPARHHLRSFGLHNCNQKSSRSGQRTPFSTPQQSRLIRMQAAPAEAGSIKIVTQGRNLKLTDALRDIAEEKATKVLGRYSSAIREVDINLSVSKGKGEEKQKCELTVFLRRLGVVRAEETAENMYAAIENVSDLVARKMRKVKEKAIASGNWEGTAGPRGHSFNKELPEDYFSDDESAEFDVDSPVPYRPPEIMRTKSLTLEPMTIEEALYQADQLGHAFYIFKDESHNVKVLYKRKHRGYGLLEPQ